MSRFDIGVADFAIYRRAAYDAEIMVAVPPACHDPIERRLGATNWRNRRPRRLMAQQMMSDARSHQRHVSKPPVRAYDSSWRECLF